MLNRIFYWTYNGGMRFCLSSKLGVPFWSTHDHRYAS